ncbi:hypothetical protein HMI54_001341 [Coelomomyces lativittatus]|nr:hypothetical protein HMI55_003127 [Coelomomyces lativittatus]KAJ1505786.1 hypothetical protein HMI56_000943 [Coelomomyces lativittatus]KAJ1510789.1 hypothetical protein HMI54_001341 [Coelomomyces lativittatus]
MPQLPPVKSSTKSELSSKSKQINSNSASKKEIDFSIFPKQSSLQDLTQELETLNENQLKERLRNVNEELNEFKKKVEGCKKENDMLRQEIENSHKDSAEYASYLQHKKAEKQQMLDAINAEHERVMKGYQDKKQTMEKKLSQQVEELNLQIEELENKLQSKNQEILSLADILRIRQKHESQVQLYKQEIEQLKSSHVLQLQSLERKLLEERMRVKKESELQLTELQSQAQAQALQYLTEHTLHLSQENKKMEEALKQAVSLTQAYVQRKQQLELKYQSWMTKKTIQQRLQQVHQQRVLKTNAHSSDESVGMETKDDDEHDDERGSEVEGLDTFEITSELIQLVNEKTKILYTHPMEH